MAETESDRTALRDHYRFDQWTQKLDESLLLWGIRFSGSEIPGWQLVSQADYVEDEIRHLEAWWRPIDEASGQLVRVDVSEGGSMRVAWELLLTALSQIQQPPLDEADVPLGDVAFAAPDRQAVFCARGNLRIAVRAANLLETSVVGFAVTLDDWIVGREPIARGLAPTIEAFRAETEARVRLGDRVSLDIRVTDPLDRPISHKLFAQAGDLESVDGTVIYYPVSPGEHRLTLIVISADGSTSSRTIDLEAG